MTRSLLAALALLALAAVGRFLLNDPAPEPDSRSSVATEAAAQAEPETPRAQLAEPRVEVPAEGEGSTKAPSLAGAIESEEQGGNRRTEATGIELELSEAFWVSGRVVLPEGTPADEQVVVVAMGKPFQDGSDYEERVGPDGSFRVAFTKKTRTGRIAIRARYAYLTARTKIKTKRLPEEPVVLKPKLGACLRGTVTAPSAEPDSIARIVGTRVQCAGTRSKNRSTPVARSAEVASDLTYEIGGVPAGDDFRVILDPGHVRPAVAREVSLTAGETLVVDLELGPAARVEGRIIDEAGEPVAGATVQASVRSQGWYADPGAARSVHSGDDGGFRLEGITPGSTTLEVDADGFPPYTRDLGELVAGDSEGALEIVLKSGLVIRGRVVWPDGAPAEGARVEAHALDWRGPPNQAAASAKADEQGEFRLSGLLPKTYRIEARGSRKEKDQDAGAKTRTERVTWKAVQPEVRAGSNGLLLTLSSGTSVSGQVVDDRGSPVPEFRVSIALADGLTRSTRRSRQKKFAAPDGRFEFPLETGTWLLTATAKGHAKSDAVRVSIPADGQPLPLDAPLVLTTPRAAHVSGVVYDPRGAPVSGAAVSVEESRGDLNLRSVSSSGVRTAADGSFTLENAPVGVIAIVASAPDSGTNARVALEAAAGTRIDGVELQLGSGGSLTGIVVPWDGHPPEARTVWVWSSVSTRTTSKTSPEGEFRFDNLTPGDYQVHASATPHEASRLSGRSANDDVLARNAEVEVIEGETAHVVLAPPELDLVRVSGSVFGGGQPLAGVTVLVRPKSDSGMGSTQTETTSSGEYSVVLRHPGPVSMHVFDMATRFTLSLEAEVPPGDEHHIYITFETGSLSGRILGPDGPLEGVEVQAFSTKLDDKLHGANASSVSNANGEYRFDALPTGTWSIRVAAKDSSSPAFGLASDSVRDLTVTRDAETVGADVSMALAGTVRGRVVFADGTPPARCAVSAMGTSGSSLIAVSPTMTDAMGNYELAGCPPGELTLSVHIVGVKAAPTSQKITVHAGKVMELDFTVPGSSE